MYLCMHTQSPSSCDRMDCSPPGSSVHGIIPAILEWVAISSSRDLPDLGTEPVSPASPALADGLKDLHVFRLF